MLSSIDNLVFYVFVIFEVLFKVNKKQAMKFFRNCQLCTFGDIFLSIIFVGKCIIDLFRPIPNCLKFNKVKMIIQALDIRLLSEL